MKTKNQTGHSLLESAVLKAANEDGISPAVTSDPVVAVRQQAWSPREVWRTRVKSPTRTSHTKLAPIL